MRNLFLVFTAIAFLSCNSQKRALDNAVNSIEDVYFEGWTAGVRGGGSGINFHINLNEPLPEGTRLEKVLFKNKEAVFSTSDSLHYTANIITKIGQRPNPEEPESNVELPESTTAKVYFLIKGKSVIHIFNKVKEKEMLAYPAMNKPR